MSTKKEFKLALIEEIKQDGESINDKAIESALRKQKLAADNMGVDAWDIIEQLGNARCFYYEFGEKSTYNRKTSLYRQ